jgi:hypothetical protein
VIQRFVRRPNPASELVHRFCNDECKDNGSDRAPFRNSKDFQIHNLKQYTSSTIGRDINSWVRCKCADEILGIKEKAVIFEQDINTLPESSYAFTADEVDAYFVAAAEEAMHILQLYFPG